MIRTETRGKQSLDDVMRALWNEYGVDFYQKTLTGEQHGLPENAIEDLIERVTGVKTRRFIDKYVRGTEDVPLVKLFAPFAITLSDQTKPASENKTGSLGVRVVKEGNDCKLANVFEGCAAHYAGLSGGDYLIAINGLRVSAADVSDNLAGVLAPYGIGETVQIHAFRRDELLVLQATLQASDIPLWSLTAEKSVTNDADVSGLLVAPSAVVLKKSKKAKKSA